jgi:hypothetical protein
MMPAGLWNAVEASWASTPEPAPDAPIDGSPNSVIYKPPANRDDEIAASDAPIRTFPKPVKLLKTVFPSTLSI